MSRLSGQTPCSEKAGRRNLMTSPTASQTLLVVYTKQHAVHWMQPEDITPEEILTDLQYSKSEPHTNHVGGLHFLFANGQIRFLSADIAPKTLRSLITRDGNETITEDY